MTQAPHQATQEAEARALKVQVQAGLQSEFKASLVPGKLSRSLNQKLIH